MKRFLENALLALNLVLIVFLSLVAFRPGGPGEAAVREWLAERSTRASIRTQWTTLSRGLDRLDRAARDVDVVEFADYQCPYCKSNISAIEGLLHRDTTVGVVFRHYPIQSHKAARGAARAAVCAEAQGRFRAMHDQLFQVDRWQADTNWIREALAAGIQDTAAFRACLSDKATEERIDADIALGQSLGVEATPTFFTRRERHTGLATEQDLLKMVGRSR